MTGLWLGILGIAITGLTLIDALSTTFTISGGGGPVSAKVANYLWGLVLHRHRGCRPGKRQMSHQRLTQLGYFVALTPIVVWLFLLWMGWTLIFSATPTAIVDSETQAPADLWSRAYFTGYTLFTLGLGDYKPQGPLWQMATAIASFNGFFLVTFSISYLIPVVSAAIQGRQLATYISSLGRRSEEIVLQAWNGKSFGLLDQHLINLAPMIAMHAQLYPAYPVLFYFHSATRARAAAPNLAALDEALTILEFGLKPECRPDAVAIHTLRNALSELIDTLSVTFIQPSQEAPPLPNLDDLRDRGIPTVSDRAFAEAVESLAERRRLLLAAVYNDGWCWDDVTRSLNQISAKSLKSRTPGSYQRSHL